MVSCVPNAGLPIDKGGKTFYTLPDDEMTDIMERFLASYRIDILGGCCGTTPAYINKMRSVVDKARKKIKADKQCFFSGFYKGVNLAETHPPIIVGERINTHGSRKMKGLLRERDFDGIMETGKAQENTGADILDVCTVLTERKTESEDMVVIFKELAQSVQTPLMVDSTDEDVIKAALENYPGTAFINSVNLEDGGAKADRIFELAKEHGSFIVNLVIDGKGMAKTVERKVEIADKLYSRAVNEFGIEPCRMIFDMLTFTLGTGEKEYADSAVNTLGAIKLIKKKHPEALTILGISNVSFGLSRPARKILNRLFLHHALKNSLDLCIINPADYFDIDSVPEKERLLAENLIFNRNKKALNEFVEYFSVTEREQAGSGAEKSEERSLTIEEKIIKCIFDRDKKNITRFIDEALLLYKAEDIINNLLMGAMKDVGEKLDKGEMVLPFVLQSAEVMRKALEYLEKFLEKGNIVKGKVLLATVFGDVHDIGKNLVKMILQNHGFTVIDLGKQVPVERIVSEAKKNKVDAVGLSALLVSTARHMRTCVQAMHEAGLAYPLLIGGAPISRAFARDISFLNNKSLYKGGVFYAKDAFTGLNIIQALMNSREKEKIMRDYLEQLESGQEQPRPMGNRDFDKNAKIIPGNKKIPVPPFYGIRTLINIPADEVFSFLDEKQLFNLAWGAKLKDKKKKERLIKEEYKPLLEALKQEVIRKGLLELKAVYGYFKCRVDSKGMRVLDKENKPACDILFERDRNNFSLADYFSGEDIVSFQVVTVGDKISTEINKLSGRKEQTKAFFLHGLSVYLAEALAAYIHSVIRRELGLKEGQGKRYSPGYPLWRKISDQEIIFRLLDVNKRLGIKLTGEYQMIPEQSTTAMVVYNEAAEY
jgi:5-methyltetrahydrofolate--homocysteine methyltransferase